MGLLDEAEIETVPIVHRGPLNRTELDDLIGPSRFGAEVDSPLNGRRDGRAEGRYLRAENETEVTGRSKLVRPEFVEEIKQSTHWQQQAMVPNESADGVDIWS